MNRTRIACAIAGAALAGMTAASMAADRPDYGKREFDSNCAVCHGRLGKGDGPYAGMVDTKGGADITQLTKKNGGVFPIYKVTQTIDGRFQVKAHGPREMPIWGADYLIDAKDKLASADTPFDPEVLVTYRIYALAEYVSRLQAK
ncbi:MAG: cytochrome C [Betaproteobacteria bacterium]|nr:cytochrome C [Betaproteobacteria bacterium]PWB58022.1 MAG: cytochrome C [Betaproteobacteria bacterium]